MTIPLCPARLTLRAWVRDFEASEFGDMKNRFSNEVIFPGDVTAAPSRWPVIRQHAAAENASRFTSAYLSVSMPSMHVEISSVHVPMPLFTIRAEIVIDM